MFYHIILSIKNIYLNYKSVISRIPNLSPSNIWSSNWIISQIGLKEAILTIFDCSLRNKEKQVSFIFYKNLNYLFKSLIIYIIDL